MSSAGWSRAESHSSLLRATSRRRAILNRARRLRLNISTRVVQEPDGWAIWIYGSTEHRKRAVP